MPLRTPAVSVPTDLPTGAVAQTYERRSPMTPFAPTSGRMVLSAIYLRAGTTVTSLSFTSGSTALATPSHGWGALYDPSLGLLGQSANDVAIAWAAFAVKQFTLATPVVTTVSGWHYAGFMVVATTMPTVYGVSNAPGIGYLAPSTGGFSTAALTATAPATAAAPAFSNALAYAYVS